jgi:hypothetical protein
MSTILRSGNQCAIHTHHASVVASPVRRNGCTFTATTAVTAAARHPDEEVGEKDDSIHTQRKLTPGKQNSTGRIETPLATSSHAGTLPSR